MMLVVVKGESLLIDEGLQSVIGIRQGRQLALTDLSRACASCCGLTLGRSVKSFQADQRTGQTQAFHHVSSCYFISHDISSPRI